MGIPEEIGGVSKSVVESFKDNPLCLAVVVLSTLMMVFSYFTLKEAEDRRAMATNSLIERCFPLQGKAKE